MPTDWPSLFHFAFIAVAGGLLLIAALHDVIARTVPNWVSLLLALTGLSLRFLDSQLIVGTACGIVIFVLVAFCWRGGWLGGGDVKQTPAG